MANTNVSREEVKSIVSGLEKSPSMHDDCGYYGGKPNVNPTAHSSEAVTKGTTLPTSTSEFKMTDRGNKISGFSSRFAKGLKSE